MWKCGKLEAANKNHDFSLLRYSLKFMFFLVFIGFPNVFVLFFIGFENHVLLLLAVPMFLSSWSWFFMVSIVFTMVLILTMKTIVKTNKNHEFSV